MPHQTRESNWAHKGLAKVLLKVPYRVAPSLSDLEKKNWAQSAKFGVQ